MFTLINAVIGIIIILVLLECGYRLQMMLEFEGTNIFKYLLNVIFIGWIAVAIFAIYPLQLGNIFSDLESSLGPISEFFSNLFNSDDKFKFLFQNDIQILKFIFLAIVFFVVIVIYLAIFCLSYAILSFLTAYLLYLPCRYFYLLLWGYKSVIRNARANSKIFQIFEFLIWGLVALIILLIYLKVKNSYLSS